MVARQLSLSKTTKEITLFIRQIVLILYTKENVRKEIKPFVSKMILILFHDEMSNKFLKIGIMQKPWEP